MSDFLPILLALLFVFVVFGVAVARGVVPMLSSGCAVAGGMVVMALSIYLVPVIGTTVTEEGFSWQISVVASAILALVATVILRIIFGLIFRGLFGGGRLSWMTDKLPGGILSLFPAAVGVVVLFTTFRVIGTLTELNYTASLGRQGVEEMVGKIPGYPKAADWRNRIEAIPAVPEVLDLLDPFSHRSNRNAAAMVMVSQTGSLRGYMATDEETAALMATPGFNQAARDPAVEKILQEQDRAGLVLSPRVRQVAVDSEVNEPLRKLDLKRSLEGFVKSLGQSS